MADTIQQDLVFNWITKIGAFAEGIERGLAKLDEMDRGLQNVEKSTSFANRALGVFSGIELAKLKDRLVGVVNKVKELGERFIAFAKTQAQEAARIEVQWRTLSMTAANMGVGFDEAKESINALRASGIKTSEALQVMTQWLSAGLPADKLKELSRAAQDLAVTLGTDSTQAMERFNWFVQTGNSELLRTVGIMQTSTQMEERFAASISKTREQLTDQEKRLARVNGLLEATATYAGAYEEAMQDVGKRITSLPRLISNVTEVIGAVFVPLLGAGVDILSDLLEKIERLFRVTKKEAKETGATIGEWKEGFLRLRAVVTAFANWFMSIWERITGGFNEAAEGMMDRFVNTVIRAVKTAADALRRFATFMASIFGGRAPAPITGGAIAATKPEAKPEVPRRAPAPAGPPVEEYVTPKEREKLLAKPVEYPAEQMAEANQLLAQWRDLTAQLAAATEKAAKAKERLAKAEEWFEKASERVYDIRRKIAYLELQWAEVPERFVRGRKRQLQMELMAAEHEEHERKKVVDAERERSQAAEEYRREIEKSADAVASQIKSINREIANQLEKYNEWKQKLEEASEIRIVEPVQAVVNEFESLDDLTAGYLEEIEGELMPAFASIEESVLSIASSFGAAWEKAKGMATDVWDFLTDVKGWFDGLPDWAKKILTAGALILGISWLTGAGGLGGLVGGLTKALTSIGMALGPMGWALAIGVTVLTTLILKNKEELAKWFDPSKKVEESWSAQGLIVALQKTAEWSPMNWLSGGAWSDWWDNNVVYPLTERILNSQSDVASAAEAGVERPMVESMERMSREIVGASIVPEMVTKILDWFDTLQLDLTPIIDKLVARVEILDKAFKGITPTLKEFGFASGGQFKVTIVNLQGSTFGGGLSEWDVRDAIYDAIGGMV